MSSAIQSTSKGKERAIDVIEIVDENDEESDSDSDSSSDSDSDSSTGSDSEVITQDYLNSLLEQARRNILISQPLEEDEQEDEEEDIITLDSESTDRPLPPLNPGTLPPSYFTLDGSRHNAPTSIRDPDIELAEKAASSMSAPAPPLPPAELTKSGKPLTKREKKELKNKTAGPDWFDLPAPAEADLPRLYREVEALRLRNQLDPKRFYRKEEGEGKGIKGLPKHFAVGTIVTTKTPFGGASGDNLTRANRKRTLVEELVDDAEAKRYAKKKFEELQRVKGAKGRNTLNARNASRRGKW